MSTRKEYTVFLVDDDQMFLKAFSRKVANSAKVKVKSFSNAEDCLSSMDEKPDLIVTDFYLANGRDDRMNGDQLLKEVQMIDKKIPVMMMSAQEHSHLMIDFLQMGAADYLDKNKSTLESSIENIRRAMSKIRIDYQSKEQKKILRTLFTVLAAVALPLMALNFVAPAFIPYYVVMAFSSLVILSIYSMFETTTA